MSKYVIKLALCFAILSPNLILAQNVGVNRDGSTPHASAMLDIDATDAGILVPRLTAAQKDAISTPATGLLIYQTDNSIGFYYYNGSSWVAIDSNSKTDTFSFMDRSTPAFEINSPSYYEITTFIFRGTAICGTPTAIKSLSYCAGEIDSYDFRLYDLTNGQTIAELTGITGTTLEINDFGTLNNLPTGEAIFQLSGRRNSTSRAYIQSLSIQY